ncbi:[Fe-Fe] hydrogenase large subunit C-terminal domain-containing protein [Melioribacter sp. OK-6-Me]|uniref:[Fe-Fe] hydrogenase large subunit C-terminal domain-containing protein n=1 Tax=unclassified Melioribacter TaxID=2627329 RepID=UPI003EDAAC50
MSGRIIYTIEAKCRDCYRCLRNCPVNAISIINGQASVDETLCILCGNCLKECPQNAKQYRSDIEKVKHLVKEFNTAISVAPSYPAFFEEWESNRLPSVLRKLGFKYVAETSVAASNVAMESFNYYSKNGKSLISSACPSVVNYIEKHRPELIDYLAPFLSPMMAHAGKIKYTLGDNWKVVFVGPCVAKKDEAERPEFKDLVDAVITFEELYDWMNEEAIEFKNFEESNFDEESVSYSRLYPLSGGMIKTALTNADNLNDEIHYMCGWDEIKDSLKEISKEQNFIEPLMCKMGCINGPGAFGKNSVLERKRKVIDSYNKKQRPFNPAEVQKYPIEITRAFKRINKSKEENKDDNEIIKILNQKGIMNEKDELNCGACGYNSCRENAIAVLNNKIELESCIPYMRRLAEQRTDKIIESSPNGIVILDRELNILSMNEAFKKFFVCGNALLGKKISCLMDPEPFIRLRDENNRIIEVTEKHKNYNLICHQIIYKLPEEDQYVGIFVDITRMILNEEKLNIIRRKVLDQARELLNHQIMMAQNLTKFLGESTAKGEELVEKLMQLSSEEKKQISGEASDWIWKSYTAK